MKQLRIGWLAWLLAAMLFFSGTPGSGWFILLLLIAGFAISAAVIGQGLLRR